MKHNITKLMLTLVFALLTLPMQSQDFMNIFFKDGSFRKFYMKNVTEITTSKVDEKGTSHSDYKYQHIKTKSDKYVYNLDDVDSITFTKINEVLAEQNFVSAMPKVLSAIDGCETIDDVESKVDEIKSAEGVADAWSDGHQLYVTIAEDETYSIHFNHDAPESDNLAAQVREIKTRASKIAKKDGTPLKAVIANQQHKDESRAYMVEDYYMPLIACLQECGVQVDYVKEPTVDFFYNNSNDPEHLSFYDYDMVYLKTHGSYEPLKYYRKYEDPDGNQYRYAFGMKGHGFETSDDIAELKENYWYDNYKTFKKWRDSTPYHDLTDVQLNYTIQKETRNGKEVYIAHPFLTEYFFRDIALGRFKNPNSFLFNSVCESLKGDDEQVSYSFANILFDNRNLGVYAGYTRSDCFGYETGPYLFLSLLCGGSLDKSFDDLPDYCKFESLANIRRYTKGYSDLQDLQNFRFNVYDLAYYTKEGTDNAELKIFDKSGSMPSDFFLFPTTTVEVDNNDINKEYSDNKTITIEGYSTHLDDYKNPWEDYGFEPSDIEIGFELGEPSNLGPSFAVHSSIKKKEVNSEHGKYHFQCTIPDLEPGKTYHYRAYTYDGENYNYGKSYSFKIGNPEDPNVDPRVDEVIPADIREKISEFMPIYDGTNPPNIEGAYFMDPNVILASSWKYDYPGKIILSQDFKFFNQDMTKNTIDMYAVQGNGFNWKKAYGAFISGSGDNFTMYCDAEGESGEIWVKGTYVISGTITSAGIANFVYTYILKEKGDDPKDELMKTGTYRIFKDEDGLAEKCEWTHGDDFGGEKTRAAARGNELPCDSSQ